MRLSGISVKVSHLMERFCRHWETSDLFQVPFQRARELGFKNIDAKFLEDVGLPNWAAPNIMFHFPLAFSETGILLGEDGDTRALIYEKPDRKICVSLNDGGKLLVAPDLPTLVAILIEYAELVDQAILSIGSRAFLDNKIPDQLIDVFEGAARNFLGDVDSIWTAEIARLRSHIPK